MKITEFPEVNELQDANVFLIDGPNGTKVIKGENLPYALMDIAGVEMHRMLFRGKKLGFTVSSEQKTAIQNGTFKDLWLGDYWEINDIVWRIVDFDRFYGFGDTPCNTHHVVLMPDTTLYSAVMNDSNTTSGGYLGSNMYTSGLTNAKTIINNAFGNSVLTYRDYFTNAVTNDRPTAGAYMNAKIELPNECMLFGHIHISAANTGIAIASLQTIANTQLALFAVAPKFLVSSAAYWTRDISNNERFAFVDASGIPNFGNASVNRGVRPVFAIC